MDRLDRRRFLRNAGLTAAAITFAPVVGRKALALPNHLVREAEDFARRPPALPDVFPKIDEILAPLASVPAIVEAGGVLRVELDAEKVGSADDLHLELVPRFGAARAPVALTIVGAQTNVASPLWRDRAVTLLHAQVPSFEPGAFVEDLYDLRVRWPLGSNRQPRAVKVVEAIPQTPRFAIIADPSVGDPRPIQEGAEDFYASGGDPDPMLHKTLRTLGTPPDEEMWAAFNKCIDEVNLANPDFVLICGDLTFAFYPRPLNYELEEAYRLINRLRVPTFVSPGNHDLYNLDYDTYLLEGQVDRPHTSDGKELWPLYFGPLYWSTDVGDLHIMSLNSFDWPDHMRAPIHRDENDPTRSRTRSGGYVSNEQFDWIASDLRGWRSSNPRGGIVTFAHHNPSWRGTRFAWPGPNRLEIRDLLAEVAAGVHFAGHTHDDRIARYHADGDIVETNGNHPEPVRQLNYLTRSDQFATGDWTQEELAAIIREPGHGPVFVDTTTAGSGIKGDVNVWGLGSYWGWRLGVLDRDEDSLGYDPADFGYPATQEFIDTHAERPQNWTADHAPLGVFSYPSYFIDEEVEGRNDGTERTVTVRLTSRLLTDLDTVVPVSLRANDADEVTVTGGQILRARSAAGVTDLWLGVTLPKGGSVQVEVAVNPS